MFSANKSWVLLALRSCRRLNETILAFLEWGSNMSWLSKHLSPTHILGHDNTVGRFLGNIHQANKDAIQGKGPRRIMNDSPGGATEHKYGRIAGTLAAAYFTGGAVGGLAGGGFGGAIAGGAAGGAVAGGINNDDNRWKGAARGAALGGAAGGAAYGLGQYASGGATTGSGAGSGSSVSGGGGSGVAETGAYDPKTGLYDVASDAAPIRAESGATEYPGGVGGTAMVQPGSSGIADTATGVPGSSPPDSGPGPWNSGYVGANTPATPSYANGGTGLSPSVIGGSGQLSPGMGPQGDVAGGVGNTDSLDYSLSSDATDKGMSATGHATNPMVGPKPGMMDTAMGYGKIAAKYGLPVAGLATQLMRKPGIPQEGQLDARYASQNAAGEADLANARAGNVTPSQRANIDRFKSDSMSSLKQYMSNSGQGVDSTAFVEMKGKIDQAGLAMENGYVDQLFSRGLSELGLADSAQSQLINLRMQREQNTSNAMNNFMMTLGMMGAFA